MCDCSPGTVGPDVMATNALCPNRAPPKVAFCVVGAARTFPMEQAWRSLRRHLIEAYGGHGLTGPTPDVHFQLKLVDDVAKTQKEWRFDPLHQAPSAVCTAVCSFRPASVTFTNSTHGDYRTENPAAAL